MAERASAMLLELDQIAVNRIFDCLLDNSLRIGQLTSLSISICIKSSFIDFNVSDDGPGIPDDQEIGALFDRFSRLKSIELLDQEMVVASACPS